ncbi:hypothetical protein GCM10011515_02900 [Tsuneonella deserti]|uniref:Secreted protein n=1 Tax=Tsuneonella deserti TaxID=2035528 RepID=A0ABQ1S1V0_9SPHN|nr:hypothetical protein [Tsuneonella deserti]GGD86829.1 hypothetical protein GCM10011515_02900 [Tsuneonella deserti]
MNLCLPKTMRPAAVVAALAWTTLSIGAAVSPTPAEAADGAYYRAELVTATTASRPVVGGMAWNCAGNACAAAKGTSRPAVVCARLAKEVGALATFTAGGKALEAEDLARCNGN